MPAIKNWCLLSRGMTEDSPRPAQQRSRQSKGLSFAAVIFLSCLYQLETQIQRFNLAKPQSATADSAIPGNPASLATDGVAVNTNAWGSSGARPHRLTITLPVAVQLGSAQHFLGNDDTSPAVNFSLPCFNSNSWTTIPGAGFSGNSATALNVVFGAPVSTPQVCFYSTAFTVTVREIARYGTNGPSGYPSGPDVSRNQGKPWPVIASSVAGTHYALSAADGYAGINSGWQTANVSGSHTLEVDSQSPVRISSVYVYSGSAISPAISGFTFNYWNDKAWVATPGGLATGNTQKQLKVAFNAPVSKTRVQLTIPVTGTRFVRELAVFATSTGAIAYPLWINVVSNDRTTTTGEIYRAGFWSVINRSNSNVLSGGQAATGPSGHDRAVSPRTANFSTNPSALHRDYYVQKHICRSA